MIGDLPEWAAWSGAGAAAPWTVGVEEEVMLLDPATGAPASRVEDVLAALPPGVAEHAAAETHGSALELATGPHARVADAVAELAALRAGLSATLQPMGLSAAVAGTHPLARWDETEVSPGARYQYLHDSLRELARREPTFGLHIHVAVPEAEQATRALNRMSAHLPLLLALSANSPFWGGRDSGMASIRTPLFQAFPRVGIPRWFHSYAQYVEAIDVLVRCGAIPEPSFVWWDARLQPRLGTLEIRVMDAQTRVRDTGALAALVQCLVRLEATEGFSDSAWREAPEALAENRFIAARDGMAAQFVDPSRDRMVPALGRLAMVIDACWPHAVALRCERELGAVAGLAGDWGAARQRAIAGDPGGLGGLVAALRSEFSPPRPVARSRERAPVVA
jgi:glutamate---cysteine ligase / carboxylate-amine ligase